MNRIFAVITAAFTLFLAACQTAGPAPLTTFELTILHTNDTHGTPLPVRIGNTRLGERTYTFPGSGGLAARLSYINKVRAQEENVLVLDSGDIMTGRVVSNYFQAKPDFLGMDIIGYDAVAVGNHEFDFTMAVLDARRKEVRFPLLSANIVRKDNGQHPFAPYVILRRPNGVRVAVFGLTTIDTPTSTVPANVAAFDFLDPAEVTRRLVPTLRQKAELVIVISHMGLEADRRLAQNVSGVDLILGGHSHTFMDRAEIVNGIPIFQSYQWGLFVGRVTINVVDGKVVSLNAVPVGINVAVELAEGANATGELVVEGTRRLDYIWGRTEPDPGLTAILENYNTQIAAVMAQKLGTVTSSMDEVTAQGLTRAQRRDDVPLTNFLNDAMREEATRFAGRPVEVLLQNGGGIRAGIPAGELTKNTIYTVLPFDNTIQLVHLTGAQLLEILEKNALPIAIRNWTTGFDGPSGAFLQVSGMSYTLDIQGNSVSNVKVGNAPLDPSRTYLVASNSFMMVGGDGFNVLRDTRTGFVETSLFQRDMVIAYLQRNPVVNPATFNDDRIRIVNTGR